MAVKTWGRTALTGGAAGALDALDADNLTDGMRAITIELVGDVPEVYEHRINAASGAAEASPDVIKPDSGGGVSPYAGDKRWELVARGKLVLTDTDASNKLQIKWNEDDAADRVLNIKLNAANRTLTLSGNPTLADWFDQALKQASSPTFAGLTIGGLTASKLMASSAAKALVSIEPTVFETGGAQEIDGDKLDIDFTPTYYTPAITPAEAAHVDNLAAHLYGIDIALETLNALTTKKSSEAVADEAEITLATGVSGWGFAQAGDNEQWIQFSFTAAGVVTVIANSALAVNTDTDGNLCVYDAGAGIAIKNRLGGAKTIRYTVNYSA